MEGGRSSQIDTQQATEVEVPLIRAKWRAALCSTPPHHKTIYSTPAADEASARSVLAPNSLNATTAGQVGIQYHCEFNSLFVRQTTQQASQHSSREIVSLAGLSVCSVTWSWDTDRYEYQTLYLLTIRTEYVQFHCHCQITRN